jgi:hypothetical protein
MPSDHFTSRTPLPHCFDMPYLFTCPHCGTQTQVEDRYSGQFGECVNCGDAIQLPDFGNRISDVVAKQQSGGPKSVRWIVGAIVSAIILSCLLFAIIRAGGQSVGRMTAVRDQSQSISNLKQIAKALNAYAADHGNYPPAVVKDNSGKPLHSWRVLILPYLNEEKLFNDINLTVGWDDPANAVMLRRMPTVYRHPNSARRGLSNQSGYYLVTGQGTLFPNTSSLGPSDIVDDPTQTILVIEAKPQLMSVSWAEPGDVDFANLKGNIGGNPDTEVGGMLDDGVAMVTTDERGHFLESSTDPLILRSLITPRGGERLPDDTLD